MFSFSKGAAKFLKESTRSPFACVLDAASGVSIFQCKNSLSFPLPAVKCVGRFFFFFCVCSAPVRKRRFDARTRSLSTSGLPCNISLDVLLLVARVCRPCIRQQNEIKGWLNHLKFESASGNQRCGPAPVSAAAECSRFCQMVLWEKMQMPSHIDALKRRFCFKATEKRQEMHFCYLKEAVPNCVHRVKCDL